MHAQVLLLAIVGSAAGFTPPTSRSFATFGNEQTKALIQAWQPKPLKVPQGEVMTPQGTENMKRFVRARILLEDPSIGGVASFDDKLTIILTRFNKAEHQLVLPLWQPTSEPPKAFKDLVGWHKEYFGNNPEAPRLSGSHLEADKAAWQDAFHA